ncbi:hypothetical protein AMK59_8242 [Oryctes borbonicus]|uniref:GRIP domain-containing protein n=1 Tax=Oryctes borbonicus TaxID=1629725 RepID=A0A0T6AXM3_9SCAR|nr:hypothetical protein AMK59_8242 [Oryctes borbonicus]
MDGSSDTNVKKTSLEDLTKDELIVRCKSLLAIAQKAKQAKDATFEENNKLKEQLNKHQAFSSVEVIEKLTQQKVDLLTNLEELKSEKIQLDKKFSHCVTQLQNAESKISDLDTTNQSYKRRVDRLSEENEQLIIHLDELERQIEELKTVGLQQQQQLLALEKSNVLLTKTNDNINQQLEEQCRSEENKQLTELKNKLDVSLEELKYIKSENSKLNNIIKELEEAFKDNEERLYLKENDLLEKVQIIENLKSDIDGLRKINEGKNVLDNSISVNMEKKCIFLQTELEQSENIITSLRKDIGNKNIELEQNANLMDDMKTEVHKNKALVEKLNHDIINMSKKLADAQIMSSGVTSDLQNANEKLKGKLKLYHSKIVKFANDIKLLKQSKIDLLLVFKTYTQQVNEWKEQLHLLLNKIESQNQEHQHTILENNSYKEIIQNKNAENEKLLANLKELQMYKEYYEENEKLRDANKFLKDEINTLQQKIFISEQKITTYKQENKNLYKIQENLSKTIQDLEEKCHRLERIESDEQETLTLFASERQQFIEVMEKIQAENKFKEAELAKQYEECFSNSQKVIEENDKLKLRINDLNNETEKFRETQLTLESLKQELDRSNSHGIDNKKEISNLNYNYAVLLEEKENLERMLKLLQEQHEKSIGDHNSIKSYKKEDDKKMNRMAEECEKLNKEVSHLQDVIKKYLEEKKELQSKQETMNLENEALKVKIKEFNALNKKLGETQLQLQSELEMNKKQVVDLENLSTALNDQLKNVNKQELELAEKSGEEILNLVKKNNELQEIINGLEVKIQNLTNIASSDKESQTSNDLHNFEEITSSLKRENAELLSEMNEMNQALKERGETISKQEALCEDVMKKLQNYELQFKSNKDILNKKDELVENLKQEIAALKITNKCMNADSLDASNKKDDEIIQLKLEIQELRDRLLLSQSDMQSEIHYAESENMSTSTISKIEELNRMKDLDSSWEERYGKLRNFAIKLKGKIRELTADLQKDQAEKADLHQKQAKTIQTFQQQIDKLQDDLEVSKNDCKQYLKKLDTIALEVNKKKKELVENEEVISQLKSEIDGLNKEKLNTDNWKKQVSAKIQALKKELEANNLLKKEFENKINKLNAELESKDKALKHEIERHNQTKTVLQESNNECKKQSVLNLEMHDYERSVKELSQKIDKKQELINKLKSQLETQKTSLNTLKDQNQELDESIKSWEDKYDKNNSENEFNKKKIAELEKNISEKEHKLQDLTYMIENIRSDNEDLSTQLSKTIAEHQKVSSALKEECEFLKSKNVGLEQTLRQVQEVLKMKEEEFCEIQKEYEGYKVRAQSVLRQNQSRDVGVEEKLIEEAASLRAQVDILTTQLKDIRSVLDEAETNNNKFQVDRDHLLEKIKNLESTVENHKESYEQLNANHQQTILENAETVRGLKIHSDTLAQCYRQQISEQESRHNREIIELQSKVDRGNTPPDSAIIIPSMPREEGEGSESIDSATNNGIQPVPLDKLLSNETEYEVVSMKKQISENESKVTHLAALLADAEQDLAKYVQLNKVLKEEIRRQQRSAEREKHAENLEYLKNVVFKFITLGNGDERSRLVPVLNTILKLSPEETQKLNNVARGEKGWSNYLSIPWGSANKPQ